MTEDRNWPLLAWLALLVMALIFGGGGANYGLLNLVVQLCAILVIALHLGHLAEFWRRLGIFGKLLLVSTICLPIIQAVPLPPGVWQALPGRDLVLESLRLAGAEDDWFSISIDALRTLLAASALIVPVSAASILARQDKDGIVWVLVAIVSAGLFALLLGMLQVAGGNDILSWYTRKSSTQVYGFFANRNSAGLFFVIALTCLVALPERIGGRKVAAYIFYGAAAALAVATVLTQSRSSTVLLLLPIAFLAWRKVIERKSSSMRKSMRWLGGAAVGIAAVSALAIHSDRLAQTWDRFDSSDDMRWAIWQDSLPAVEHYWPAGSGIGAFRDTIEVFESLETVTPLTSGRAHNEYLEISLEAGILGLFLLVAWWVFTAVMYRRAWSLGSRSERIMATGAMVCFAAIALQSAVDYPLRNLALMCVVASLLGVLVALAGTGTSKAGGSEGVES